MRNSIVKLLAHNEKNGSISPTEVLSISRPSMLTLPGKEMTWCLGDLGEVFIFQPSQVHLLGIGEVLVRPAW